MNGICPFCKESLQNGKDTVSLKEAGIKTVNASSVRRGVDLLVSTGDVVHVECRRNFTNEKNIKIFCRKRQEDNPNAVEGLVSIKRRSQGSHFSFATHCFFCENSVSEKKLNYDRQKVHFVSTIEFFTSLKLVCEERRDRWSTLVLSRINFVGDLHAAGALYHQTCNVRFRTGKTPPIYYTLMTTEHHKSVMEDQKTYKVNRHFYQL